MDKLDKIIDLLKEIVSKMPGLEQNIKDKNIYTKSKMLEDFKAQFYLNLEAKTGCGIS